MAYFPIQASDTDTGYYRLGAAGVGAGDVISARGEVRVTGRGGDPTATATLLLEFFAEDWSLVQRLFVGTVGVDSVYLDAVAENVTVAASAAYARFAVVTSGGDPETIEVRNLQLNEGSVAGPFVKPSIPGPEGARGYSVVQIYRVGDVETVNAPPTPAAERYPAGWFSAPQPTADGEVNYVCIGYEAEDGSLSSAGWTEPVAWTPAVDVTVDLPATVMLSDVAKTVSAAYSFSDPGRILMQATSASSVRQTFTNGGKGIAIVGPATDGTLEITTTGTAGGETMYLNADGTVTFVNNIRVIDGSGVERSQPQVILQAAEPPGQANALWVW